MKGGGGGLVALLILAGLVGSMCDDRSAEPDPYSPQSLYTAETDAGASAAGPVNDFYTHGALNVRSGPDQDQPVLRTLQRGDRVRLGPKDTAGWAALYAADGTTQQGYVYRASDLVRSYAPRAAHSGSASAGNSGNVDRRSSAEARGYYSGPRGGCYTYSSSGRKRYVDRSLCN